MHEFRDVRDLTAGNRPCHRAPTPGRDWRTGQDRTRLLVTYLWDGRCGHCLRPLVLVHELPVAAVPLDVDHIRPKACGGRDELMNYIASCAGCNRSRQANLIDNRTTILSILRMQRAVLEDFSGYWEQAANTDPAFDKPFWTAVRCADHDWHVSGSPGHNDCQAHALSHDEGVYSTEEWCSRFGSRSREVLEAATSALRRHGLGSDDSWEVLSHLPRYAVDADHALKLVQTIPTPVGYRDLEPAPEHLLSVTVPLATTNTSASARRRDHKATRELHAHLKEFGIDWIGVARLWTQRRWPSSHLFYHRSAILELAKSGKRKGLAALADLDSAKTVDLYLTGIGSDLSREARN